MWIAGVVITILLAAIGTTVAFVLNGISDTLKKIQAEIAQLTKTQAETIRDFDVRLSGMEVRHELCKYCNI